MKNDEEVREKPLVCWPNVDSTKHLFSLKTMKPTNVQEDKRGKRCKPRKKNWKKIMHTRVEEIMMLEL